MHRQAVEDVMPHLIIEYSSNIDQSINMEDFCRVMGQEMVKNPLFPIGGVRVRAHRCEHYYIADGDQQNGFLALHLCIGTGRSHTDKKQAGDNLFILAQNLLSSLLQTPYFALSMELREIDEEFSWKKNSIHSRLQGQ